MMSTPLHNCVNNLHNSHSYLLKTKDLIRYEDIQIDDSDALHSACLKI